MWTFKRLGLLAIALLTQNYSALADEYRQDSNGWSWVYQGIGHRQTFVSQGRKIEELRIRVARLNENCPSDALSVEIRDPSLELVYAQGRISPMRPKRHFEWARVGMDYVADLEPGKTYVLLFHSMGTQNDEPWVINVVYKDIYPGGQHAPHNHELFFSIAFDNDKQLVVGPKNERAKVLPINSGCGGGVPYKVPHDGHPPVVPPAARATNPPKK